MSFLGCATRMPGKSYRGPLENLSPAEEVLREGLERHVVKLATEIGPRAVSRYPALQASEAHIEASFRAAGYEVARQEYEVDGRVVANIEVTLEGTELPDEIIVIGGHYDTVPNSPGANDNGTGAAATLVLANALKDASLKRTLRFVCFVNEEPPYFQTEEMGSLVYARRCRERNENIVGMMAMETMGYFRDEKGTQQYPFPFSLFYPSTANFIGFIGDTGSRDLVRRSVKSFRNHARFPSEGAAIPRDVTGVGFSDHWSFWQVGYPALMVTDTAFFRFPHYHEADDTPEHCDFERLARVTAGLVEVIKELANE